MAFRGTYEHTLDDRGRVALPARYRHEFGGKVVIRPNEDGCIEVYPEAGFVQMSDEAASLPPTTRPGRRSRRRFESQSFDTELDRQGRVLVPVRFREMAGLNGSVVIVGRRECLEIWDPASWSREIQEAMAESSSEQGPGG